MSTPVTLGGADVTIDDVVAVSRRFAAVALDVEAKRRLELGEAVVQTLLDKGVKVYGLTTGFASMRDKFIAPKLAAKLSLNLIRSHASGVGEPFAEDVVRAALLLRANALARGNSGVGSRLVELLIAVLNAGVYPFVPQQGSVGSSGDLAPLSHLVLAAIGDPMGRIYGPRRQPSPDRFVEWSDRRREPRSGDHGRDYVAHATAADFVLLQGRQRAAYLTSVGLAKPYELAAKEGLASNNGAVFSTAVLALTTFDAGRLLDAAEVIAALSHEGLQAVPDALRKHVVAARPHPGHKTAVDGIRRALTGSDLVRIDASCGFNMARYNGALMGLAALARSNELATADSGFARGGIDDLVAQMLELRATVWGSIERSRAASVAGAASEKEQELRACERVLAPLRAAWNALVDAPEVPREIRRKLIAIDDEHLRKCVLDPTNPEVQDNYSFRAAATILGAAREVVHRAAAVVAVEINSSTDNPLVLLEPILERFRADSGADATSIPARDVFRRWLTTNWSVAADATVSAANFHGEPIGIAADQVGAALAEVGNIAERRVACLTDPNHSKGLPAYLVWSPGLNSGFMIPQYAAAGLVTENRLMAMPAATDSVPTGANCEDHVAMSTVASRRCATVLEGVERILAIELLCAYQAVQFRKPAGLGKGTGAVEQLIADELAELFISLTANSSSAATEAAEGEVMCTTLAELRQELAECTHLPVAAFAQVAACVVDDIVLYPFLEAVASLIRRGRVVEVSRTV